MTTDLLLLLFFAVLATAATTSNSDTIYDGREDQSSNVERIIIDTEDVGKGVHIDYRYNDTSPSSAKGLLSVPGCPKNVNGRPWVYYGSIQFAKCYLAGDRGPCKAGQKIFVERGNSFGYCNWNCFEFEIRDETNRFMFCSPHPAFQYVFDQEVKRCYQIFEQGPCKPNEWFVPTGETYSVAPGKLMQCEERKCRRGRIGIKNDGKVTCKNPTRAGIATAYPNSCGENQKYSLLLSKCTENFSFEL